MGITMTELAKLANVSQCAVSLVVNGKSEGRLSEKTRRRILELIEKYDFRPNFSAKVLKKSKFYAVGIVMPAPKSFFDTEIIAKLQLSLAAEKYLALFSFYPSIQELPSAFNSVLEHNVDGIISWEYHDCLRKSGIPAVLYFSQKDGWDCIAPDFTVAVRQALEYLTSLGHTRIGFVGSHWKMNAMDRRRAAFLKLAPEFGLSVKPEWVVDSMGTHEDGICAGGKLLHQSSRPTAVITMNDNIAVGLISACLDGGLRLPADLSILSFDNTDLAKVSLPSLTSFDLCTSRIVECLSDRVLERIEKRDLAPEIILIPPELVLRHSCAAVH